MWSPEYGLKVVDIVKNAGNSASVRLDTLHSKTFASLHDHSPGKSQKHPTLSQNFVFFAKDQFLLFPVNLHVYMVYYIPAMQCYVLDEALATDDVLRSQH